MLVGGGISVLKWMEIGPFAIETAESEDKVEKILPKGPPIFIDLNPLVINIYNDAKIVSTLKINLKLEALGPENAELINSSMPIITDTFLRDMHAFLPRIMNDKNYDSDIFVVKKRLKLIANALYPDGRINDVLIQSVNKVF